MTRLRAKLWRAGEIAGGTPADTENAEVEINPEQASNVDTSQAGRMRYELSGARSALTLE